ncbi:MAG: hypothetical protein ACI8XX_001560, partial [Polaribacter sp.]
DSLPKIPTREMRQWLRRLAVRTLTHTDAVMRVYFSHPIDPN